MASKHEKFEGTHVHENDRVFGCGERQDFSVSTAREETSDRPVTAENREGNENGREHKQISLLCRYGREKRLAISAWSVFWFLAARVNTFISNFRYLGGVIFTAISIPITTAIYI